MKKISLPGTSLIVSEICLGTVTYGNLLQEKDCFLQLDRFTESGYNFIDTARVYGNSENIIGKWLSDRKCRDKIILASKGAHPEVKDIWISRMSEEDIFYDLDISLKTLGTDYIDLYFLHRDDLHVPVGEIIDILERLRKSGKIRYYGCSNWTTERIAQANSYARKSGSRGFVCNQVMLSLTKANEEIFKTTDMVQADSKMLAYHQAINMSMMSYMALAGGYFIKKAEGRETTPNIKSLYDNKENEKTFSVLKDMCADYGYTVLQLLLQFVIMQPFPSIPVVAVRHIGQMEDIVKSAVKRIDKEHMEKLLRLWDEYR